MIAKQSFLAYDHIATAFVVFMDPPPQKLLLQLELNYDADPIIRLARNIGSDDSASF